MGREGQDEKEVRKRKTIGWGDSRREPEMRGGEEEGKRREGGREEEDSVWRDCCKHGHPNTLTRGLLFCIKISSSSVRFTPALSRHNNPSRGTGDSLCLGWLR